MPDRSWCWPGSVTRTGSSATSTKPSSGCRRLASELDGGYRDGRGLLAPGSPVRYYLPAAPVTLAVTLAAVARGWRHDTDRRALAAAAACSVTGAALTGYLVRTVILRILGDTPIGAEERRRLVARWHRVNRVRLMLVGGSSIALARAAGPRGARGV